MNITFSRRSDYARASEAREMLKYTERPEVISFAGGLPAPESFPVKEMTRICEAVLSQRGATALQYGTTEGYRPLLELTVELMNSNGIQSDPKQVLITCGSQQGLDLTGKVFIDEGDLIFCESPSYFAAINAFRVYMPKFIEIPMDEDGMLVSEVEKLLSSGVKPKFIYTIPDFQNPSGRTMSLERRKRLVELADKYDILIIEDNPYGALCFEGERLPAVKHFDRQGRVIYMSTFSKIFSPGLRLAWVCASEQIINKYVLFKQAADLHTNMFSQMLAVEFVRSCDLEGHIGRIRELYKKRRDIMLNAIREEFPTCIKVTNPKGGLFLWVELPEGMNARELLPKCLEKNVAFVAGGSSFANGGKENTLRLNFSNMQEDRIVEGIRRIGVVLKEELQLIS
ncbi:MAG TPA: PLP-dependent aminotransferase family protein [Clostridia bacterium]|nr:PLP-dependent aminotransferase family protein [Clostridia bacterium]